MTMLIFNDDDVDCDDNLLIPRMMSQTDRWAEAEAKKH